MSSNSEKPTKTTILVCQDEKTPNSGSFVQIPRFWIDDFFSSSVTWSFPDGSKKKGTRVPASFWKYTLHLFRWVTIPPYYSTEEAMDQFPVRPDAAVMWTAAYAVSGVMKVEVGRWTRRHDQPTSFKYDPATSHADWRCFLSALDYAYACRESGHQTARLEHHDLPIGANLAAWKVIVAREVDNTRMRAGLAPINEQFLHDAVEGRILDNYGRRIAARDKDGIVQPAIYVKQRLQKPGESDEEFDQRLSDEIEYGNGRF